MVFVAYLGLQFSHSSFHLQELHIESGFLASEGSNLLLDARVLGLLESIMALHLLFDLEVFVRECFTHFLSLQ